jgi:hypothetical protein
MEASDMRDRVAHYLDRDDLNAKINHWMQDSRQDLALTYNFHYLYKEATTNVSAGQCRYTLSSDYLDHLTLFYYEGGNIGKKLGRISPGIFDEMAGLTETTCAGSGVPEYYIMYGREIELSPTPNGTCTADGGKLKIRYYSKAPSLTADDDEDYMAIHHYEAIIYGACIRGCLFLNDLNNLQKWQKAYEDAKRVMLMREKDREVSDNKSVRMRHWKDYDVGMMRRIFQPEGGVATSDE